MQKNRKAIGVCLAVLLMFALLMSAGCQNTNTPTTSATESTTSSASETPTAEPLEEVTVKWTTPWPSVEADMELVFEEINKTVKEKLNATIDFDIIDYGQWETKIPVLLSANEDIDIVWHNWSFSFAANVAKGVYQPLDDLLQSYGKTILRDIPAAFLDIQRVDGKIYAIPCQQISTKGNVYTIKQECVDKTGFDITQIKDIFDLEPFLAGIKEKLPELYPIQNQNGGLWKQHMIEMGWEYVFSANGSPLAVKYSDDSKTVFNVYETPEFEEYCNTVHDWYEAGYIQPDIASVASVEAEENAGKYGVIIGGTVYYPGYMAAQYSSSKGYPCTEAITSKNYWEYTAGQATMLCIASQSPNPERAMMVLDLFNDDSELANTLAYGIKDKHYTLNEKNQVSRIRDVGYNFDWQWSMLNTFNLYTDSVFPENHNDLIQKTHEEAIPSQLAGFVPDQDAYSIEYSQCITAWEELGLGLQTGVLDPAEKLSEFLAALDAAGIDTLLEAVQSQIDTQLK